MSRFGILDHFVLSGIIFDKSIISNHVIHDVDNFSDHEPIVLQLCPEIKIQGVSALHVSWPKTSEFDMCKHRSVLDLKLPTEALLCNYLSAIRLSTCVLYVCLRGSHLELASQRRTYPFHLHAIGKLQVVYLVGRSVSSR